MAANSFSSNRLVRFVDVQERYSPSQDIVVEYRQKRKMASHANDWIGIFTIDWHQLDECIHREKVPMPTRKSKKVLQKMVKFPANSIQMNPIPNCLYQFVYISVEDIVNGVSSAFTLGNSWEPSDYVCELGPFEMICSGEEMNAHGDSLPDLIQFDSFCIVDEINDTMRDSAVLGMPTFDEEFLSNDKPVSRDNIVMTSDDKRDRIYDHVTLNFEETPTEKDTSMIYSDFIINIEQEEEKANTNKERTLVPVFNQKKTILPYKRFNIFDSLLNMDVNMSFIPNPMKTDLMLNALIKLLHDPSIPPVQNIMTPAIKAANPSCQVCSKRSREQKITKSRLYKSRRDKERLNEDISQLKILLANQETILDEFSQQIKNLVHDKAQLTIINDNFNEQNQKLIEQMEQQRRRLASLRLQIKCQKQENKNLQDRIVGLEGERSSYEVALSLLDVERDMEEIQREYLEMELADIKEQFQACEAFLDDVMYTLSIHGYDRITNVHGCSVDLRNKDGNVFDLYGWSMEMSKRQELHAMNLAKQEQIITNLRKELQIAEQALAEKDKTIKNLQHNQEDIESKNRQLLQKVEQLMFAVALAEEKEGALYNMLLQERHNNSYHAPHQRTREHVTSQACKPTIRDAAASKTNTTPQASDQGKSTKKYIDQRKKATSSSDTKLIRKYSDVVKNANNKSTNSSDSKIDNALETCKSLLQQAVTSTKSPPPTSVNKKSQGSKSMNNHSNEVDETKSNMRYTDPCGPAMIQDSLILNGSELGNLFMEPTVNMRQSVILEGGILPKMYREHKDVVMQESGILHGNVLKNLFRAKASKQVLCPQESTILTGDVLPKLFESESVSVSSRGSSVFDDDVLSSLFKTSSEESIETLEESGSTNQEVSEQVTSHGYINNIARLLDRALSIIFSAVTNDTDEGAYEPLSNIIQSAMRDINTSEASEPEEIVPLLSEYPMPQSQGNSTYDAMTEKMERCIEKEHMPQPQGNSTYEEMNEKMERCIENEPEAGASLSPSTVLSSLMKSSRMSRQVKRDRKFAYPPEMGCSKRRRNKKNYKKNTYSFKTLL